MQSTVCRPHSNPDLVEMEASKDAERRAKQSEERSLARLRNISAHLVPGQHFRNETAQPTILPQPTAGRRHETPDGEASYASATGYPSSYETVHGEVSREPARWKRIHLLAGSMLEDVIYEKAEGEAIAKITINRPERRNAFRPRTVIEMMKCFSDVRDDSNIGAVILTGAGTLAFCSGGDQEVRGTGGYVGGDGVPRLNVLDLQVQMRRLPKPVVAMVAGYAVGGGHILHMMCDLTISADNGVFGQTGPKVGSFDAGYGSTQMVRLIGQKKAREMWFLARLYSAAEAEKMGLINKVVPLAKLEQETLVWCREMVRNSPTALRILKAAMNAAEDGQAGIQELGHNATLLFYHSPEGNEGREAYLKKRRPDFSQFKRLP